ncbi:FAD-binding protein [Streptomyces sp. NPDC041068]|uniref:FAD-binding oxidoreductase n=1 Tax=Streptomyces sp. NPDC041068 TaxID=3155130 RepID=UPI0033E1C7D7
MSTAAAVRQLEDRVRGRVLLPGEGGFDTGCAGFQTAYRHRPSVLVRAACAEDVAAAVAYAAERGQPVAAQATGHGLALPLDGGVLISTADLTAVTVGAAGTASVGAGTRAARVVDAAARYGLAPLNGSSPTVGVVGYTLGGGLGLLARQFGYAADHVRSVDVVTPDGRARHVTADSDPELFWALRGAGANFGVVTGMELELVRVTRIYGGELVFDAGRVPGLMETYRKWTADLPDELTSSISQLAYPDQPGLPDRLRGRYVTHIRIAYTGDARDGADLVAPLRAAGPRLSDTVAEMPYTECAAIYNDPVRPHAYLGDNVLLGEFGPEVAAAVEEFAGPGAPVPCVVDIRHLGGALGREPEAANAVGHREAACLVRLLTPLAGDGGNSATARAVHRKFFAALEAGRTGRFQNLVYGGCEDAADTAPAEDFWEPEAYRRLVALKSRIDPDNMLRANRNIAPATRTRRSA